MPSPGKLMREKIDYYKSFLIDCYNASHFRYHDDLCMCENMDNIALGW